MKKLVFILSLVLGLFSIENLSGQSTENVKTIKLEQVPGGFTKKKLKLKAGKSYVFDVTNKGIDHEVALVVAPKGKTEQTNHIQNAYLEKTIKNGENAQSKVVQLPKGEYVYFCPLNPTPEYTIVVK